MRKILIHEAGMILVLCLLSQLPAWSVPAGGAGSANLEIIPGGLVVKAGDVSIEGTGKFVGSGAGLTNLPGGAGAWTLSGSNLYPTQTIYKVGIGTTDPTVTLEVRGSLKVGKPSVTESVLFTDDGRVGLGVTPISNAKLNVGGNINMSGGNLFYGSGGLTFSPLTFGPNARIIIKAGSADQGLVLEESGGSNYANLHVTTESGVARLNIGVNENNGVFNIVAGSVGIGTATPEAKLHVAGTASIEGALNMNNQKIINLATPENSFEAANKSYVDIRVAAGAGGWTLASPNLYATQTSFNVGIGTAEPSTYKLNVYSGTESGSGLMVYGNMVVTGAKNSLVETPSYGKRKLYAVESPDVWFEDVGKGQLTAGKATIAVDPIFQETIDESAGLTIFIQLTSQANGTYVEADGTRSFTVHETGGGTSGATFNYRALGKRRGYADLRLTAE
ncbi:hypothetical protein A2625_00970 [candidate division WOR-1 bacterium RIFCSPHIGHO2_01_FULL_53_15]|uniref:Uncharacterized protein n=1 Tax=candidate division WOR-1 bacterium RIFCSPHIGHO2_01_FULL_53_15 TaxID=1802564 RepID=A0A1F4Q3F4_UNCSA|nr:MAG: hypothetical protein A2625_00970 [candidate division WOR-1 bacterium RIFCSPHIGHO2_01_FULL_53_15]